MNKCLRMQYNLCLKTGQCTSRKQIHSSQPEYLSNTAIGELSVENEHRTTNALYIFLCRQSNGLANSAEADGQDCGGPKNVLSARRLKAFIPGIGRSTWQNKQHKRSSSMASESTVGKSQEQQQYNTTKAAQRRHDLHNSVPFCHKARLHVTTRF